MNKHPELGSNLSEQDFNALLTALGSTALVSMTDVKGNILYINDTFVKVSKYKREELIGQNHRILKSGHQPQEIFDDLWRTISSGKIWRGEIKNKAKDGSYYWVDTSIAPVADPKTKKIDRYIAVRFLITERKEQEENFEATLQALNETALVSMTDAKGNILYANDKFVEVSKYKREELIGQNHRILKSEHQSQEIFDHLWETISSGKIWRGEIKNKAKDGSYYWVDTSIAPILNDVGVPDRYIAIRFLITDQKNTSEKLESIIESSDDAIISKNLRGKILSWNSGAEKLYGYNEQEMVGQDIRLIAPDALKDEIDVILEKLCNGERVEHFETQRRKKDGEIIDISMTVSPLIDSTGQIFGASTIARDITEKKKKESTLAATLASLNQAALVSMTDLQGNITYANDKFVEVSKYKREELIGQNHRILKSGHQPQEIFDDLWGTISDGRTWRGEIENKAKDGSFYWVDTTITPILNAQYVSTGYMAVRFLITDKKEAELKLQKAFGDIQKFMLAVERSYETTVITDTNGIIQYVNPAFTKLTGYTAKEAIGKNPRVLQSGKTPKAVYENMWSLIANGESFVSDELVNKRKDGSEYYADIAIYPVMEGGKPQFFVAIQRDVTQRKKEERAKAEFVSIASHQLRTPLTAIRWSLGRFSKNLPDNIDDPSKTLLDAAMNASKRMGETINAMLNMSRLAAGKIAPTITDVHFNTLLKEMCHELEPQYTAKHITVDIQCSEEWSLRTDEKLLKEIINNLLTNAIKYTPPQGKISIGIRKDDPLLIIDIADNGYGIPKAQQENIFSKFFRADNVLDKEPDGNGIGLYLVKELAKLLGGNVTFVSKEGTGTTFTVTLPLAPESL